MRSHMFRQTAAEYSKMAYQTAKLKLKSIEAMVHAETMLSAKNMIKEREWRDNLLLRCQVRLFFLSSASIEFNKLMLACAIFKKRARRNDSRSFWITRPSLEDLLQRQRRYRLLHKPLNRHHHSRRLLLHCHCPRWRRPWNPLQVICFVALAFMHMCF